MKKTILSAVLPLMLLLAACSPTASLGTSLALSPQATAAPASQVQPVQYNAAAVTSADLVTAMQQTLVQIYQQVNPSVVFIEVTTGSGQTGFGSMSQTAEGSGFVWDTQGNIVTNNHVVEGASQIMVTFADGSIKEASLVGADPESDLAVIHVDVPASQLHPVTMADSTKVQVGDLAIAIGNPYGLSGTMTQGIVSALSRSLPINDANGLSTGSYTIPDIIQTDAAINPGNSGGVLVDVQGQVIGVTTAIQSSSNANSGIGFVVPSHIVQRVVPVLIKSGAYQHPRMGISGTTLTPTLAEAMGLSADQKGALVVSVLQGSPAQKAGLQGSPQQAGLSPSAAAGGDVITAVDGQPVSSFEELTSYIFNHTEVGQTVRLTVLRNGSEKTVDMVVDSLS